jgi:hypothetical protein
MTREHFIPVSAMHDQIEQLKARLVEIEQRAAKERADIEQEIAFYRRAIETLAVGQPAQTSADRDEPPECREKRNDVSLRILYHVRRHPRCLASDVADRYEKYAKPYGVKSARKVVTDAIFDLCRRGKLERTPAGELTVPQAQGGEA